MNSINPLYRKIIYLVGIVVLLLPLFYLGQPATRGGNKESQGGKLEQLRKEYGLGQAELGDIDPASEAIRLATLGARGIATTLLWSKVNNDKMTEDWTSMEATLKQLAKLQPYFIAVWRYQAWNLSYNVSVELDDVKDRFFYVKEGVKYLQQGIQYNRDNPSLLADLGWFIGNKIGRADEKEFYRRLFRADDELHKPDTRPEQRDNWLVSKDWYQQAMSVVDDKKKSLGGKNPTTFFSNAAKSQINYADAIENEGTFGERARQAWSTASRMWRQYGTREMMSSFGVLIRLEDAQLWADRLQELIDELDALDPGLRDRMATEARESLTPEEKKALEATGDLSDDMYAVRSEAEEKLTITPQDIAARIAQDNPSLAKQVRRIANQIDDVNKRIRMIASNSGVANYDYWRTRCDLEQTPEALKAHELCYDANRVWKDEGEPERAREMYEEGFRDWAAALDKFPELPPDSPTGSDIMVFIEQYGDLLNQLDLSLSDEELASAFPLWDIVEANDMENRFAAELRAHLERTNRAPQDRDAESLINPGDALIDRYDEEPTPPAAEESAEEATDEGAADEPAAEEPAAGEPSANEPTAE
ncbi:MAG: hypothetical protein KDA44_14655 [Planctomycetales bacterium]|nr:hypothetical protein [Planctomycetales bacterium]